MKDKVSINIIKNRENDLPEVILDRYISEKFEFSLSGIVIKDKNKYIAHLKNELDNIEVSNFNFGFGKGQIYIEKKDKSKDVSFKISDCFIYINEYSTMSYVEIYTKTIKEAEYIFNLSKDFMNADEEVQVRMHHYYLEGKLLFKESILKSKDLGDIIPDYYPDFSSIEEFFKQFTISKENILVLSGKAGIGKTKLTTLYFKYLIENIDILDKNYEEDDDEDDSPHINIAYIKNEDILSMDGFWVNLKEYKYDIVVLDDLDYFLSPRSETADNEKGELKRKFISNFLSFTDGLIPNKTKFVISTNRNIDAIDEALKRDGRLFGVFEFSQLKHEEAKAIWLKSGLDEKSFLEEFPEVEEVLQGTLGSKIHSYLKNNNRKQNKFLKDDSKADISYKFLRSKKVGF